METDLHVLHERISRLEALLGPDGTSSLPCIHERTRAAQEGLRRLVPDEMAAARRAVALLSHAAPSLRGLGHSRRARAARAEAVVDSAAAGLVELEALLDGVRLESAALAVEPALAAELSRIERAAGEEATHAVEEEERSLDRLLVDFNDATARLNARILALAGEVREAGAREEGA